MVRQQKAQTNRSGATTGPVDRPRDPKQKETDMRLKQHRLIRPFALTATAAMIAMTVTLAFGPGVGLAADYQDANHNVCEGTFSPGSCEWASHVTNLYNVALGDSMMPALTNGFGNVALNSGALASNTSGSYNFASGVNALASNTTGSENIASGENALRQNTIGNDNIASGLDTLAWNTIGNSNIASGASALNSNTTGSDNLANGSTALLSNTTGNDNLASGVEALWLNTTGSANVAFGRGAGKNLTTGSNNIDISNQGVAAEKSTTRIGTEGNQTKAFMAGVYKKPITTPACAVKVNSAGQLGCNPQENSTAVATFASRTKTPSGNCLAYTDIGPAGAGACPAKTTGFSSSVLLAGPTPANGASVTNLYADSSATVSGTDTVLVAVIDNTTGATLLSCTLTSASPHSCSNASGSGSAAAGENIEVKLTATGPSGNEKLWRVTFRF
jgi:hypothetical protein